MIMTIRKTVQAETPVLRETAALVTDPLAADIQSLITDLIDTLHAEELVGIAAPQIGVPLRVFIAEIRKTAFRDAEASPLQVFINPTITHRSTETIMRWEGCGSVEQAGCFGQVKRNTEVTVAYVDQNGIAGTVTATRLLAQILQHEIDHLNGVLFIDHVARETLISRDEYIRKHKK